MKSTRSLFQGMVLICMILVLLFFQNEVRDFIVGVKNIMYGAFGSSCDISRVEKIEAENKSLKKQIEFLNVKTNTRDTAGKLVAHIYSSYPFNDKVRVVIDKGSDSGVGIGMPVLASDTIVIGKIVSVRPHQSEAETIYDPNWKTSVVLGVTSTKAVLVGGNNPRVEFIPKDAKISGGDDIFNISPEFPMRSILGSVKSVSLDEKKLWQVATIDLPFSLESIDSVTVLTRFP